MRQNVIELPLGDALVHFRFLVSFLQCTIDKSVFGIGNNCFGIFAVFFFECQYCFFGNKFYVFVVVVFYNFRF